MKTIFHNNLKKLNWPVYYAICGVRPDRPEVRVYQHYFTDRKKRDEREDDHYLKAYYRVNVYRK